MDFGPLPRQDFRFALGLVPRTEGARALSDVIFGVVNPSGSSR